MKIEGDGVILHCSQYQEKLLLIKLLSENHGMISGMTKKPSSKKGNIYSVGNFVEFQKFSRLPNQLGAILCEVKTSYNAQIIFNKVNLMSFNALSNIIFSSFSEYDAHKDSYYYFLKYLKSLNLDRFSWLNYFNLEISILKEIGFGLDFSMCAATGEKNNLKFVSPKTGRAVSEKGAIGYENLLLKLPEFILVKEEPTSSREINEAFDLLGYFFNRHLWSIAKGESAREYRNKLKALL